MKLGIAAGRYCTHSLTLFNLSVWVCVCVYMMPLILILSFFWSRSHEVMAIQSGALGAMLWNETLQSLFWSWGFPFMSACKKRGSLGSWEWLELAWIVCGFLDCVESQGHLSESQCEWLHLWGALHFGLTARGSQFRNPPLNLYSSFQHAFS